MLRRPSFFGKTAIVGVGYTEFSRKSGKSVLRLAMEACRSALEDAGLESTSVNGMATYGLFGDSVSCTAVATSLAIPELTWAVDVNSGGMAPSFVTLNAAMAVNSGMADVVVIFRALNGRSGIRVGSHSFRSPTAQYRYPIGFTSYSEYMALIARRYLIAYGGTEADLGAVAVSQRATAQLNPRAILRKPLTLDDYFDSPLISDPFRVADCTAEVDGGCAIIVTSLERARTLRRAPIVINGGAWVTARRAGLDIADMHLYPDYTLICQEVLADRLWRTSGLKASDMDFAEIYDCFTSKVLYGLEALGFTGKGQAADFIRSGATSLTGALPTNTHGGLLCEGYLHGMNSIAEAVLQLQGRAGERQVSNAGNAVVTSGAFAEGSALILSRDSQ